MRADVSRIYDMGTRVGSFSDTEPDTDPGQAQSVAEVKGLVQQMQVAAAAQRTGIIDRRAGAAEKESLRREILAGPVTHLAQVGRRASRDVHELGQAFQRKPSKGSYVEFLTASRTMQAEAEQHKAVLLKYGLSESVLAQLGELLDRFDAAVLLATTGGPRTRARRSSWRRWRPSWRWWCGRWTRGTGSGSRGTRSCWRRG